MSLKDAVSALRSLKAELEASRAAKAELENAYRGVLEELRVAKETRQHQPGTNSEQSNGRPRGGEDDGDRDEPLQEKGSNPGFEEVKAALEEEARELREELAAVKAHAEEAEETAKRELQEAVSARDEAIGTSESARAAVEAAEDKLAKEQDRAEAAERELTGAAEDAALLRTRLDETCKELESTRDALATTKAAGETRRSEEEGEDAAELENELRSVREAVAAQPPSSSESIDGQAAASSAASLAALKDAAAAADERASQLQDELASAVRENVEMRESIESARQEKEEDGKQRSAQESEAAAVATSLAEATSRLAEKEEEVEGLRKRLAEAEEAAEEAKEEAERDKASGDENATALAAALEEATEKIASLGAKLSTNMETLDKTRKLTASEEARRDAEASSLRQELGAMVQELGRVTAMASASEAQAEKERTLSAEALPRIKELETVLQQVEEHRSSLLEAAAAEATTRVEERAASLAEKETAEERVREAEARASTADAAAVRLKSKVAALKERLSQAEKDAKAAVDEKEAAEAARAEADGKRQGVEETLLVANKELQRLKLKSDEALSESEDLREECSRLSAAMETLRAEKAGQVDGNKEKDKEEEAEVEAASPGVEEAREEIARLRNTIQEMERARDEAGVSGSGADGRGGRSEEDEGEEGGREEGGAAEGRRQIIEERDSLIAELGEEKRKSAVRVAGLETQLADKEREAADTQRRLYLRQSELETELEDLNAHHDALRVEMARMDASMQDAADASLPSSSSVSGRGGGGGASGRTSAGRDPAALGAEVGGAVGGVLTGRFWSGWRGGGGGPADAAGGATGRVGGQAGREEASKTSRARGRGRGGTPSGVAAGGGDATTQESINRVRENMMARLQDAASQPVVSRDGQGDENSPGKDGDLVKNNRGVPSDDKGGRNGNGTQPDVPRVGDDSAAGVAENEWVEETVEHPAPDYGVDSPVIRYLLQQWSGEPEKLRYLSLWLRCVIERRKVPDAFPSGLQLVGLAPEVKDGFLTLVIPMIRFNGGVPVLVHSRRSPPDESLSKGDGAPDANDSGETELWDLRVKVDLTGQNTPTSSTPGSEDGAKDGEALDSRKV